MVIIEREVLVPPPIENTITEKVIIDGIHKAYIVKAESGYILHDTTLDTLSLEDELILGFTENDVSCEYSYNFDDNPREFYTLKV